MNTVVIQNIVSLDQTISSFTSVIIICFETVQDVIIQSIITQVWILKSYIQITEL